MLAPGMWRELMLPYHRRIVEALDAPLIWHSVGDIIASCNSILAGINPAAVAKMFRCQALSPAGRHPRRKADF